MSTRVYLQGNFVCKLVLSNMAQTARGEFLNANFVGYNYEAAVSNLFAEEFWFSKPCFYCTSHSFAKTHSSLSVAILLIFVNRWIQFNRCCHTTHFSFNLNTIA